MKLLGRIKDWLNGKNIDPELLSKIEALETRARTEDTDRLWYRLAELNEMTLQYEAATYAYTRAVELCLAEERHDRALSGLLRLTTLNDDDAATWIDLAHSFEKLGRRRDAADAYHIASQLLYAAGADAESLKLTRHAQALKYRPRDLDEPRNIEDTVPYENGLLSDLLEWTRAIDSGRFEAIVEM